jgi:hypothetical protein
MLRFDELPEWMQREVEIIDRRLEEIAAAEGIDLDDLCYRASLAFGPERPEQARLAGRGQVE